MERVENPRPEPQEVGGTRILRTRGNGGDMDSVSLESQVEDYFRRTGGSAHIEDAYTEYRRDKGFMVYLPAGEELHVLHTYGDGRYWLERAKEIGKKHGCTKLVATTRENRIDAFCRLFGFEKVGYVLEREL